MTRIVERPAQPDPAARDPKENFAWLFDEYAPSLRGYLAGRVGYDPERAPIRGWLDGIATTLLRNHVRRRCAASS